MGDLLSVDDLFVVGLGLEIAGAFILGRGLLNSPQDMMRLSGTYFTANPASQVRQAQDRVDGQFGLLALVAGFGIQAFGYALLLGIGSVPEPSLGRAFVAAALAVLSAAAVFAVWLSTRWTLLRRGLVRVAHFDLDKGEQEAPDGRRLRSYGLLLGKPKRDDESDTDYARRVWNVERVMEHPTQ